MGIRTCSIQQTGGLYENDLSRSNFDGNSATLFTKRLIDNAFLSFKKSKLVIRTQLQIATS